MFNQPAQGGGFFEPKNALGHLVLVTKVHDVYHNPNNVYNGKPQPRDEAKVDMVDLDGDQQLRERITVTHPGIVNRLITGATNVLGRIGTVPTTNGNPAYVLDRFDEQNDVPRAQQWVQAWQSGQFQQGGNGANQGAQAPQAGQPAQNPGYAPQGAQAPQSGQSQGQWQGQGQPAPSYAPPAQQGYQPPPQQQGQQMPSQESFQQGPPQAQQTAPPAQYPQGVDPQAMAQLQQQLGATPAQQQPQQPPY